MYQADASGLFKVVSVTTWGHILDATVSRAYEQVGDDHAPGRWCGWLATTTQQECGQVLRAAPKQEAPGHSPDAADIPDQVAGAAESELLRAECPQHCARPSRTCLPTTGS